MKTVWIYLASNGISVLGNSVALVVWPWLVLQRTGDPAAAGLVATCIAVPSVIFALIGGQIIDTFGRKPLSIISDIISGLSVLALIAVDNWLGLSLGWFIVIGIFGAVGDVPGMAAREALAGDVSFTSGKSLDFLYGLNQTLMGLAIFVGPALSGVLLASLPINQVLWITAGCSLIAAVFTSLLRLRTDPTAAAEDVSGMKGWLVLVKIPVIRLLVVLVFVSTILVTPYLMLLIPAHFESVNNPTMLGIVHSSYAVGMMLGGGLVAAIGSTNRKLIWTASMAGFTVGFGCLAVLQNQWLLLFGMAIAGVAGGILGPLQMTLITEAVAENLRGRAFSLFSAIGSLVSPFGLAIVTAALTQTTIYTVAIALAGVWMVLAVFLTGRGLRLIKTP